jgi:hypothetical protein
MDMGITKFLNEASNEIVLRDIDDIEKCPESP